MAPTGTWLGPAAVQQWHPAADQLAWVDSSAWLECIALDLLRAVGAVVEPKRVEEAGRLVEEVE